jgi:hypothetical protein
MLTGEQHRRHSSTASDIGLSHTSPERSAHVRLWCCWRRAWPSRRSSQKGKQKGKEEP